MAGKFWKPRTQKRFFCSSPRISFLGITSSAQSALAPFHTEKHWLQETIVGRSTLKIISDMCPEYGRTHRDIGELWKPFLFGFWVFEFLFSLRQILAPLSLNGSYWQFFILRGIYLCKFFVPEFRIRPNRLSWPLPQSQYGRSLAFSKGPVTEESA
jgi:hypothetical protein